jgi:hypothetical protein
MNQVLQSLIIKIKEKEGWYPLEVGTKLAHFLTIG